MQSPNIIRAQASDKDKLKSVLKLGFANDALIRWVFPQAKAYLNSFDQWMEEFSKAAFKHDIFFAEESFAGASIWHPPGEVFDESVLEPTFNDIPAERLEAVEAGCAKLIGVDQNNIFKESIDLLNNPEKYLEMSKIKNPFGQGDSSKKIYKQTLKFLNL